jgi:acetoacetyl-[acyl-carrier protein] synthase
VKSYLGHTVAPAGGDQLATVLGTWHEGWVPGITSIEDIAEDVHKSNLEFPIAHKQVEPDHYQATFLNSKGFGGNNATAAILSPQLTRQMLEKRYGRAAFTEYRRRAERPIAAAADYDDRVIATGVPPLYQFGEGVVQGEELGLSRESIVVPGFEKAVDLTPTNPYPDMISPAD